MQTLGFIMLVLKPVLNHLILSAQLSQCLFTLISVRKEWNWIHKRNGVGFKQPRILTSLKTLFSSILVYYHKKIRHKPARKKSSKEGKKRCFFKRFRIHKVLRQNYDSHVRVDQIDLSGFGEFWIKPYPKDFCSVIDPEDLCSIFNLVCYF